MGLVLVIDDDLGTQETFATALKQAGHDVYLASTAREGRVLGRRLQPDVALVDLVLPDAPGMTVVRSLRESTPHTAVVVVTGFGTTRSAVEAMQIGAAEYLEKPIHVDALVGAVEQRLSAERRALPCETLEPHSHASEEWAAMIIKAIRLPNDPRNVTQWAGGLAMSAGAVRARCRIAGVPVQESLNLARMLRVAARYEQGRQITDLLDIVDSRTLIRFLKLGRSDAPPCQLPIGLRT